MWTDWGRRARGALHKLAMLTPLLLALQCHASAREEPTGGETHFLTRCAPGSTSCGPDLVCTCGVCSLPCSEQTTCDSLPSATCSVESEGSACGSTSGGHCDVTCQSDPDCRPLSPSHRCAAGRCRAGEPLPSACPTGDTSANDVVILGDAFFAVEHRVTAYLEDAARASGALSIGHRYRDYSSLVGNTLALQGNGIEQQYLTASAESAVKVVIMNGGGGDVLGGSCDVISAECPLLTAAAAGARALFERLAADSVEHVVYAFYPDPLPAELREEVSALRPLLEAECAQSPVPCEWVDLRATFEGNEGAFLTVDGTVPTAAGAEAAAGAIFAVMQRACIAQ